MDHGDPAQVEQVLAGAAVAGAAALPVPDVGEDVLDRDAFAELRASVRGLLAAAADRIWQIGHDVPKALLREVRRGTLSPDQVRAWAPRFRADLLALLAADLRAPVRLHDELTHLASTYAAAMRLDTDITAMNRQPPGMPTLLMAEAVRELLNNASYHRYGYPARLTGCSSATQAEISVHNDGPGVDPRRMASAWALKQNIIHRFEAAGGSYHICSAPGTDGTTVVLCYPGDSARGTTAP
jgi:hypothetical protein